MPPAVVAIVGAAIAAGTAVVGAIDKADATGKANKQADIQHTQEQAAITTANAHQSEFIRQQALVGQRDQNLMMERNMAAWRSNFAGTQLTGPGGVTPQVGMSKTTIGG